MSFNLVSNILPAMAGAGGGYLYYRFIGCASGTCPITSNPWSSTVYGAVLVLLVSQFWS